jgi:hypothetical protein
MESRVPDVIAVADDMGLETFALGGMSEGGPLVLTTAATRTPAGDGRHASSIIRSYPAKEQSIARARFSAA